MQWKAFFHGLKGIIRPNQCPCRPDQEKFGDFYPERRANPAFVRRHIRKTLFGIALREAAKECIARLTIYR